MGALCCAEDSKDKVQETAQEEFSATGVVGGPVLTITFRTDESPDSAKRVVNFKKGPLGMSFNSSKMPIIVKDVNVDGEAKSLGVEKGMVIEKIAGEDVADATYDQAFELMKSQVEKLPKP
mmetsp:Transcript_67458/g.133086  ORF Transcript_67458/g.133086 Transcript_67458/m.133086 type:complete len:121 (-) Transcript_67458:222-584(-)